MTTFQGVVTSDERVCRHTAFLSKILMYGVERETFQLLQGWAIERQATTLGFCRYETWFSLNMKCIDEQTRESHPSLWAFRHLKIGGTRRTMPRSHIAHPMTEKRVWNEWGRLLQDTVTISLHKGRYRLLLLLHAINNSHTVLQRFNKRWMIYQMLLGGNWKEFAVD